MKTISLSQWMGVVVSTLVLGISTTGFADDHGAPSFSPVEIYMCNFKKGKDADDLAKATANWNKWMDGRNDHSYLALSLTPYYNDPELGFETAWLGAWENGAAMGESENASRAGDGPEVISGFFEAVDCPVHAGFAAVNIKAPPQQEVPETGVMTFTDCSIAEGKTPEEAAGALRSWSEYLSEKGHVGAIWTWWPAFGGAQPDFDFKLVSGYPSYKELGAGFDAYTNGGGYKKANDLFKGLLDCDVPRVYDMSRQRQIKIQQ